MPVVRVMMILAAMVSGHLIRIKVNRMNADLKREGAFLMRVVHMDKRIELAVVERQQPDQECQRPTFVKTANHASFTLTMGSKLVLFSGLSSPLPPRRGVA